MLQAGQQLQHVLHSSTHLNPVLLASRPCFIKVRNWSPKHLHLPNICDPGHGLLHDYAQVPSPVCPFCALLHNI